MLTRSSLTRAWKQSRRAWTRPRTGHKVIEVLGQVAQQAGRLSLALDAFNKALSIDPKLTSAALALGDTYWMNKQPDLARQQFEKAAQQDSGRSYAMARLGQIYEAAGDFENARISYEKALAADPDNVVAKNNLAWVYAEHGGNIDVALKLAEEAKEKAPEDPSDHRYAGLDLCQERFVRGRG